MSRVENTKKSEDNRKVHIPKKEWLRKKWNNGLAKLARKLKIEKKVSSDDVWSTRKAMLKELHSSYAPSSSRLNQEITQEMAIPDSVIENDQLSDKSVSSIMTYEDREEYREHEDKEQDTASIETFVEPPLKKLCVRTDTEAIDEVMAAPVLDANEQILTEVAAQEVDDNTPVVVDEVVDATWVIAGV
jgi:hypothetical protein